MDLAAKLLNTRIVNAQSDGALADIVEQHVSKFNEIHVSTAATNSRSSRGGITRERSTRVSVTACFFC